MHAHLPEYQMEASVSRMNCCGSWLLSSEKTQSAWVNVNGGPVEAFSALRQRPVDGTKIWPVAMEKG